MTKNKTRFTDKSFSAMVVSATTLGIGVAATVAAGTFPPLIIAAGAILGVILIASGIMFLKNKKRNNEIIKESQKEHSINPQKNISENKTKNKSSSNKIQKWEDVIGKEKKKEEKKSHGI